MGNWKITDRERKDEEEEEEVEEIGVRGRETTGRGAR